MSTDYESSAVHGFWLDVEDLGSLKKIREEKSHMEPRYDPKTGEKREVKVIDVHGGDFYFLDGIWCETPYDLAEAIRSKLRQYRTRPTTAPHAPADDPDVHIHQEKDGSITALVIGYEISHKPLQEIQLTDAKLKSCLPRVQELLSGVDLGLTGVHPTLLVG